MAKKKKLNKQVVILLSLVGVVVLIGIAGAVVLSMPKDVAGLMAKGDQAYSQVKTDQANAEKHYADADGFYSQAITAASKADKATPEMYNKLAEMLLEWIDLPTLTQSDKAQKYARARDYYRRALLIKRTDLKSQQRLAEMIWSEALSQNRWMDYIKEADSLIALDPTDHKAFFRRAICNAQMAKNMGATYLEPARNDFQKAIELKGDQAEYWGGYAEFLNATDPQSAEPIYKKAIETIKDKAAVYVMYGDFLMEAKDRQKEALAQYEQGIKVEPSSMMGYLSLARFYISQGDLENSRKKLLEAKAIDPTDHRVWGQLAAIASRQGKYEDSLNILREGIKAVVPKNPTSSSATAPSDVNQEAEHRRVEYARADLYGMLVNSLLDLTELKGQDRPKLIAEAKSYRDRLAVLGKTIGDRVDGRIAFCEGRLDDARKFLEAAHDESSTFDAQTSYMLAHVYMTLHMAGKTEPIINEFLTKPGYEQSPIGHIMKAQVFVLSKDWSSALKELNQALTNQPGNRMAIQMKAEIEAINSGTLPKETIAEDRVPQYLDRSASLWMEDRKDDAIKLVESLHERMPDNLQIVSQLAMFYTSLKQEDKAKQLLSEALKKYPDNANIKRALDLLAEPNPDKRLETMLAQADAAEGEPLAKAMEKARIYQMFNKDEAYAKQLTVAAGINSKSPAVIDAQFRLATGKQKDWAMAEDCARRAGEINPVYGKAYSAQIYVLKGDMPQAATILNDALRERPDDKQLRTMLGECYLNMNDLLRAEQEYRQVIEVDPGFASAVIGMARVMELLNKWSDHAQYVERAYKIAPQNTYIQQAYLKIQVDKQTPAEAIKTLEGWRKKNPDDLQTLLRLANVYERDRQLDKAEELYKSIYARAADNKLLPARWLITFYLNNNRNNDVEGILNQITKIPDKVGAYILYGDIRAMQGTKASLDQAKEAYKQAIDMSEPKDGRAYQALAMYYVRGNMFTEAIEAQRKFIEREPGVANEKILAKMLLEAGQLDEAGTLLANVLKGSPTDPDALVDMSTLLVRKGQMSQAIAQLDQAVQSNSGITEPLLQRASLLIVLGQTDKAVEDLKTVHRIAPGAEALRMAAGLYIRMHDEESAESMYNEALNRQPENRQALLELASLYLNQRKWDRLAPLLERAEKLFPQIVQFNQMEAEMWKRRLEPKKRVAALEAAYKASQDRDVVAEYVAGLYETNQPEKGLEIINKETRTGSWVDALKARGMVNLKNPAGEDLFKQALKDAPQEEVAFVLNQAEKAFGLKTGLSKLEGWLSVRPDDWVMLSKLADLYAQTSTADSLSKSILLQTKALNLAKTTEQKGAIESALGVAYHQLYELAPADKQNLDKAEVHYLASLDAIKDNPGTLNNLAYMYTEIDKPDKGLVYAEKAVKLMPNSADVLDTYGWTLLKLGKTDTAEITLVRALQGEKPAPVCRYHLGYLYEKGQNLDKAKTQYQMGLNMFGQDNAQDATYKLLQEGLARVQSNARNTK